MSMLSMLLRLWRHDAILLPVLWDPISSFVQTNGWFFTEPSEPGEEGGNRPQIWAEIWANSVPLNEITAYLLPPPPLYIFRPSYGPVSRYSTVFVGCFNTKIAIRSKYRQIRSVIICNCGLEQLFMWIWISWASPPVNLYPLFLFWKHGSVCALKKNQVQHMDLKKAGCKKQGHCYSKSFSGSQTGPCFQNKNSGCRLTGAVWRSMWLPRCVVID